MAQLPRFDALAPRRPSLPVDENTGAGDTLRSLARVSGAITDQIVTMAGRAAQREGREAGLAAATTVSMPGVGFAFREGGPSVSVKAGQAKSYLMDRHGFSDVAASAITGHLDWESGLRTGAVGDKGTAVGLAQWRGERLQGLKAFAAGTGKDWRSMEAQLDYVAYELGTSEAGAGKALSAATTLDDAVAAFMGFERPAGWTAANPRGGHGWAQRLARARALAGASTVETSASAAPATTVEPGSVAVTLNGAAGPVPAMRAGTIRGDAFNDAAASVYTNRLEAAMRAQMDAVSLDHETDPQGLASALDALRAGYLDGQPPEVAAPLALSFERQKQGLVVGAGRAQFRQVEAEQRASYDEIYATRMNSAARLAARAGEGDEQTRQRTEAALAAELDGIERTIDASPMTPLEKSRRKREARSDVFSARVLGGFDNLTDPAERAQYVKAFQEQWKNGEGFAASIDAQDYQRINAELVRGAKADEVEAGKRAAALDKAVTAQLGFLKKGYPVSRETRNAMAAEIGQTGDAALQQRLAFLDGLSDWQRAYIAERPEVVDAQISLMRDRIASEGANEAALTTLDVMEGLSDEMRKGLSADPLTWAQRAGVTDVAPLDLTDGATLTAGLPDRAATAHAIADHYGIEPRFFTPAEVDEIKKKLNETPLAMPSLASSIVAGLGTDAPAALAEISKDAPVLAHIGGLIAATGEQRLAVEAAEALEMRRQKGYKSALPTDGKLRAAALGQLGGALAILPGMSEQVLETAAAVFERRAAMRGLPLDDFATEGAPSRALFVQALDETLGAHVVDDVKYGGLTEVNGHTTVAPPDLPADSLQDMLLDLSNDDLLFQEGVGSVNGVPVKLEQLRRGRLVLTSAKDGRYRIALGDMEGGDPRYVTTPTGGVFELDARMLARSQAGRPQETPGMRRRRTIYESGR